MKHFLLYLLFPALLFAQEFEFRQEYDTIPVEINGWQPFCPWAGGMTESNPAIVDIDCDGDDDLFGGYYGQITLIQNEGTPELYNFNTVKTFFESINVGDRALPEFCDIDADNDLDLFICNEEGKIWFYLNDGDSVNYNYTYVTNNYNNIWVDYYAAPEFADIDGDEDYDLFVGREQVTTTTDPGDIFFYKNLGTPQEPLWEFITKNYISLDVGYSAQSATTDINADLDEDIFIQHIGDLLS